MSLGEWEPNGCVVCRTHIRKRLSDVDGARYHCPRCGDFVVSNLAERDELDNAGRRGFWTNTKRAALSHLLRTHREFPYYSQSQWPFVNSRTLADLIDTGFELPLPSQQARNLIRHVGNFQRLRGEKLDGFLDESISIVGSIDETDLVELASDVRELGLLDFVNSPVAVPNSTKRRPQHIRLTLSGWREWESIKSGARPSDDGFIAMQFGNERLDRLVSEVVRPAIEKHLSVKLNRVDSPGTARAGLIDNIMRDAIESAAFVLVELSHGNRGAYWEAGLAEGLGKPVIYLCEKAVWDDKTKRPHFDVNHRTTIMWEEDEPDEFVETLIATIRTTLRHHYPNNQE